MRTIVVIALLGFTLAACASAASLTPAQRQEDVRLAKRVTLRSPHILIGELFERLSRQSGVALTADDWSGAGDDAVTVALKDVPVGDAMDALWSLFSYRNATWDWRRTGDKGQYTYKLVRTVEARALAQHLRDQVQQGFEAQAAKMVDALKMTPDELKDAAQHDPLLDSMEKDYRVRPGLSILAGLPSETQMSVLRNQQPFLVPVSELSDEARAFVHSEWQSQVAQGHQVLGPDGTKIPLPEPTQIYIRVDRSNGLIAPSLLIDVGSGSGQFFGGAWMEKDLRQKINTDWMLPGDAVDDPTSARVVTSPKKQPVDDDKVIALGNNVLQLADAARVPVVARLPASYQGSVDSLLPGKPVQATLDRMADQADLGHKWRGGILLLTHLAWYMDDNENSRVPWTEVQRLRDAEATGNGFLPLKDIARAAYLLNADQMHNLSDWFPVMSGMVTWRKFLAWYDQSPEFRSYVSSPHGSNQLDLAPPELGIEALEKSTHDPLRLRLKEQDNTSRTPPGHEIVINIITEKGKLLTGQGFGYSARQYQTHLHVDEGAPAHIAAK